MNEPSVNKLLIDAELIMHALLDSIIDNSPINFSGLKVPQSIIDRIQDALDDGRLKGSITLND